MRGDCGRGQLFEKISADSINVWFGFAFERFCLKHATYLANLMGFQDEMLLASPLFRRGDSGFQIDLVYKRVDKVIVACEIKFYKEKISTAIVPEMEKKCTFLDIPKGYTLEKALISLYGEDDALKKSGYFNYSLTVDDILGY